MTFAASQCPQNSIQYLLNATLLGTSYISCNHNYRAPIDDSAPLGTSKSQPESGQNLHVPPQPEEVVSAEASQWLFVTEPATQLAGRMTRIHIISWEKSTVRHLPYRNTPFVGYSQSRTAAIWPCSSWWDHRSHPSWCGCVTRVRFLQPHIK